MKTLALLLLVSTAAYADDAPVFTEGAPAAIAQGTSTCDAVRGGTGPASDCKKVAAKKVDGIGKVTLYSAGKPGDFFAYALVIDGKTVSPKLDLSSESSMGGKHENLVKAKAKLRAIQVKGKPAAAVDVVARFESFTRYAYLVCANDDQGTLDCVTASFGGPMHACTARLSDDGVLTHACEVDDGVSFAPTAK